MNDIEEMCLRETIDFYEAGWPVLRILVADRQGFQQFLDVFPTFELRVWSWYGEDTLEGLLEERIGWVGCGQIDWQLHVQKVTDTRI